MSKNPFINALAASVYIVMVATIMNYGSKLFGEADTFVTPIAVLSLFVLSAALMGYFFLYQPFQLYFDGKKKEGVKLFLETVGVFAVITLIIFVFMLSKTV